MSAHSSLPSRRGLPFWVLAAVLPLALSLGFVTGMGLAHYRLLVSPLSSAQEPPQSGEPVANNPPSPSSTEPIPPLQPVTLNPAHVQPTDVAVTPGPLTEPSDPTPTNDTPPISGPTTGYRDPDRVYTVTPPSGPPVTTITEARTALMNDRTGSALLPGLEYQQMRNADGSVSLVGILSVEQYLTWEATLRRNPDGLKTWLQAAADLVLSSSQKDRFALSWALVETRLSVPSWALPSEITALADGRFLVVRYLAGTTGLGEPKVEIRSPESLGSPSEPGAAWSRYGPQIRFDGTDIYRPSGVTPKQP